MLLYCNYYSYLIKYDEARGDDMDIRINTKTINLDNVYFGYEAGRYYDKENKEFCTFVDRVIIEKTRFSALRNKKLIYFYVDVLSGKSYLLDSKNKVLDGDSNIINNYIEDTVSITNTLNEYKEIVNTLNEDPYTDLINKFEDNIVPRRLFFENLEEIISLKDYIYDYKNTNNKVRTRV